MVTYKVIVLTKSAQKVKLIEVTILGIIEKLDHFTKTGISGVWLSPIYKSPQVDNGYDISDYRDIGIIFQSKKLV